MSNLSERVERAKKLVFSDIPGVRTATGGTWGSKNDHYQISLSQKKQWEKVQIADQELKATVIYTCCKKLDIGNGKLDPMEICPGNSHHTVCYHSLGFLVHKLAKRNKEISFYQSIMDALNGLNFGGQLTKVVSKQGDGYIWAIIRDKPQILSTQAVNLMRGEDDEGID
jgi:hypothetical protein